MKKLIHKILCIKVSRVIRFWNAPENSIAVQSLYLFGQRLCDVGTEDKARRRTDESFRKMLELMQNREDVMREIADHLKKERQKQEK